MNAFMAKVHVGWACVALGAFEEAECVLRETLAVATARSLGGLIADFARLHLGAALAALGRLDEAVTIETDAIARLFAAGNWLYGGAARAELARILLQKGDVEGAEREARAACEGLSRVPPVRVGALAVHSRVLLAGGDAAGALAVARVGAEFVERAGLTVESEPRLRLALANALEASGAREDAGRELLRAAALLRDRASRIAEPTVARRFLDRVPEHAEIIQRAAATTS
jgi:tetratricopeptide (TPR) repeat protein